MGPGSGCESSLTTASDCLEEITASWGNKRRKLSCHRSPLAPPYFSQKQRETGDSSGGLKPGGLRGTCGKGRSGAGLWTSPMHGLLRQPRSPGCGQACRASVAPLSRVPRRPGVQPGGAAGHKLLLKGPEFI